MDKIVGVFLLSLVLGACGGSGGGSADTSNFCADTESRQRLVNNLANYYLWYTQLPAIDLSDSRYCSLPVLLEDLRYQAEDRFSYIQPKAEFDSFFDEGTYEGFGFGYRFVNDETVISFVYGDSAAGRAGMLRGDTIMSIDGESTAGLSLAEVGALISLSAGNSQSTMVLRGTDDGVRTIEMGAGLVVINTVLDVRVVEHNGLKVGYLAFKNFLEPSRAELDTAFALLSSENIDELVLDLRYNGGGRIDVSRKLASLVAGQIPDDSVFTTLQHNDRQSNFDFSHLFASEDNSLNFLNRVLVLTLADTCSASELIINGLRPWLGETEVVTIGSATCGKPLGSYAFDITATSTLSRQTQVYSLSAINFRLVNSLDQGGYVEGISADCAASDELGKQLGDPTEAMFAAALAYVDSGTCATGRDSWSSASEGSYRVFDSF
ncbi:MAG: S41 family peptidase [Pseudomonadota bacterium]